MKKLFTPVLTAILALFVFQLSAQTARMAFVEEATQASCPPCATFNPGVQTLVNANSETTIFMGYQVSWPGFDQMNLDNPTEVAERVSYYGINAAPTIVVQGTPYAQTFNQSQLNNATAGDSEFAMDIAAEIVNGELLVTGSIEATMAASGNFKLRIALVEELITIQDAPGGTNGETEYHHVFKKFLGDGSGGIDLENTWVVGDTYEINETLVVGSLPIYHFDGLEVVAWIQNDSDKYVHQAAVAHGIEITSDFANNGTGLSISGLPPAVCSGDQTVTPVFKLQNGGSENLTSADVTYSIDGGAEQMVSWTGDLSLLGSANVTLDPISFVSDADGSILTVTVSNPNGVADENTEDSSAETLISPAAESTSMVELTLVTDNYGNETYWQITDGTGAVVASGGNAGVGLENSGVGAGAPPADAGAYGNNQTVIEEIALETAGCYSFTITDYWGDGICCGFGAGSYVLKDHEGNVMFGGGEFTAQNDDPFEGLIPSSVADDEFVSKFSVSPNPISGIAFLDFTIEDAAVTTISVLNTLGQEIQRQELGKIVAGNHNVNIDMSNLNAGMYLINVVSGEVTGTKKVIVNK